MRSCRGRLSRNRELGALSYLKRVIRANSIELRVSLVVIRSQADGTLLRRAPLLGRGRRSLILRRINGGRGLCSQVRIRIFCHCRGR